jgi:hypothetical protein
MKQASIDIQKGGEAWTQSFVAKSDICMKWKS